MRSCKLLVLNPVFELRIPKPQFLPVNSSESDIWQLGQGVGPDLSVECLYDLWVLAVVHGAPGPASVPHGGAPGAEDACLDGTE